MFGFSRTKAAELAADGKVTLDGSVVGKSDRVMAGAWMEVEVEAVPVAALAGWRCATNKRHRCINRKLSAPSRTKTRRGSPRRWGWGIPLKTTTRTGRNWYPITRAGCQALSACRFTACALDCDGKSTECQIAPSGPRRITESGRCCLCCASSTDWRREQSYA